MGDLVLVVVVRFKGRGLTLAPEPLVGRGIRNARALALAKEM